MIIADRKNPKAQAFRTELLNRCPIQAEQQELTIVIGGDGFLLKAIFERDYKGTFLGLNAGHLGFLLNDVDDWEQVAADLDAGNWVAHDFPLLQADSILESGERHTSRAINDVYVQRTTGHAAHLGLSINGERVVEPLVADGIIFATALGSTAYTYSAGGPPSHPSLKTMSVTPICPHHPRLSPFALPLEATATVDVLHGDRRPVQCVSDGRAIELVQSVTVSNRGENVRIAYFRDHDFTQQMVRKILHP
jgi:NAD+ kinase